MLKKRFFPTVLACALVAAAGATHAANKIRVPVDDERAAREGPPVSTSVTLTGPTFGDYAAGDVVVETATLTNTRSSPVNVGPIGPASVSGAAYAFESTTCGSTLAAGASCTISVRMATTTQGGPYTGSLTVNAAGPKTTTFSGTRSAANPQLTWIPRNSYPGAVTVGQNIPFSVTVRNTGNVTANSLEIFSNGSQSAKYQSNNCQLPLKPGQSCQAFFRYEPANTSQANDGIVVRMNGSSPWSQGYVYGLVNPVGFSVSPALNDFGTLVQWSTPPERVVTFTNNSGSDVTVTRVDTGGAYINDMPPPSSTCTTGTFANGASCTIRVSVFPYAKGEWSGMAYMDLSDGRRVASQVLFVVP